MGNFFMSSVRFNKQSPEEFGLVLYKNPDVFIKKADDSKWKARGLYDFGWGKENGFYKLPMPDFNELINIILESEDEEDKYGAAAVILDEFSDELLERCTEIVHGKEAMKYLEFFHILQIKNPINRSSIAGKTFSETTSDFQKWKELAENIKILEHEQQSLK